MKLKQIIVVAMILISVIACQKTETKSDEKEAPYIGHKVTVAEVLDGKTYTYLRVMENDVENWLAISKRETKEGEVLYFTEALEMENFESKELARTFDKILFVSSVSNTPTPISTQMGSQVNSETPQVDVPIEAPKDGISIAELYTNKDSYKEKMVLVKGKITKVNKQIMNRNWYHIQDGSSTDSKVDLTVTTNEDLKIGDVVTFKGIIAVAKDFGAGYKYDVIMETATVVTDKAM